MAHPQPYGHYGAASHSMRMPDPERGRRTVGLVLYILGMTFGALLLVLVFLLPAVFGGPQVSLAMLVGAILAFPAMCVYLLVPRLLDRYDPEPLYALVMALAWGAVAACGFSAMVNTIVGYVVSDTASAVVSAPLMEEATKGMLLLGFFYFLRREFDGVVDGIIYASFVAIGFAAVENVIYYANEGDSVQDLRATFFMRGLLTPWLHPLFTAMTGIGVGLARESTSAWLRFLGPPLGYMMAVCLHALWNGSSVLLGSFGAPGFLILMASIVLWLIFVVAFLAMVFGLVLRRGRIIRAHLIDEVALGHLTQTELNLVASAFGGFTAYLRKGSAGTDFVRAVARLALSKWHTGRAMKGKTHTVSMEFIVPLRRRIRELRAQGASPC